VGAVFVFVVGSITKVLIQLRRHKGRITKPQSVITNHSINGNRPDKNHSINGKNHSGSSNQ
jgi:hypothetical protein